VRVIGSDPEKFHVVGDDGDITHYNTIREHIVRVDRRHEGNSRGLKSSRGI